MDQPALIHLKVAPTPTPHPQDKHKDICSAATVLQISPRVQDHEETSTSVALCLAALQSAREAACVCLGVQCLRAASTDPSTASQATTFAASNADKFPSIPKAFWDEFADLAAGAGLPDPTVSATTLGNSGATAMKSEDASPSAKKRGAPNASAPSSTTAPLASPAKSAAAASSVAETSSFGGPSPSTKSPALKRRKVA